MPVVEIATWVLSDAYYADPTIVDRGIEFLLNTEGCQSVYWGFTEGDKKAIFLFIVWEAYEHHKALIDRPGYPDIIGFVPSIGEGASMKHVEFNKDFEAALGAPLTEVVLATVHEGKEPADLAKAFEALANGVNAANPKYAPATWGVTLESSREYYAAIGWDSMKAFRDTVGAGSITDLVKDVVAIAKPTLSHVSLKKAQPTASSR
ncbi:hypothetical protein CPC08DRAFT_704467 [Agrocybe pediades]|nr:hypothetical protein CPC08DRAFT_704467 [Agrocybe pediades]